MTREVTRTTKTMKSTPVPMVIHIICILSDRDDMDLNSCALSLGVVDKGVVCPVCVVDEGGTVGISSQEHR